MLALQAMTPERLAAAAGVSLAHARKAVAMIHRGEPVAPTSVLPRPAASAIAALGAVPTLREVERIASELDPFVRFVFHGDDGLRFESVRIPLELGGRYSVCVSSQVGCALACGFCATGRLGLVRNLETWEIVEQVRAVAAASGGKPHGVVFQGMGEPLANLDRVLEAIAVLHEPAALGIDARNVTVSTAGLPRGIERLAREAGKVRLAISIGSAREEVRRELMPISRRHPLDEVLAAAVDHAAIVGRAAMWAVTLLDGVNDTAADADALIARAHDYRARTGALPRLSVLAYNPIGPGDRFRRTPAGHERQFRDWLHAAGVWSHRRYSGGADVAAACGQLAAAPALAHI